MARGKTHETEINLGVFFIPSQLTGRDVTAQLNFLGTFHAPDVTAGPKSAVDRRLAQTGADPYTG